MKNNFEKIKQDIELIYLPLEIQEEKTGYLVGNSFFDDNQLTELKGFKLSREKIWKEIEDNFDPEKCFNIAGIIYNGFLYLENDQNSIRDHIKIYRDAKKRINEHLIDYIKKQNERPFFRDFPLKINDNFSLDMFLSPHYLDEPHPARSGSRGKMKTVFIKQLSAELKERFPAESKRSEVISRVLRFFFAVPNDQAKPRNIRNLF